MKLNKIEKLKLQKTPCEYYENIASIDPKSLTEADRFYLKNFGIYNNKQRPDEWMVRIRIPAGRITHPQLLVIHELACKYRAQPLLTARAQIELQKLDFQSALSIHKTLENAGITTFQVLSDNIRNIVTDPLDGVGQDAVIEVYPLIVQMQNIFLKNCDFVGLVPRKFNTAISGNQRNVTSFFAQDCYFALAKRDEEYGFNLYLGGKNSELAQDADIFVHPSQVVPLFEAIVQAYKKYGLRSSRTKARLYHLLQEIGLDGFKEKMREFYPKDFLSAGTPLLKKGEISPYRALKNGKFAYRHQTDFGLLSLEEFAEIVELAKSYEVRLGVDQNIYIIGLENTTALSLPTREKRAMTVCAGECYCVYSLFDTKEIAKNLSIDPDIRIGFSGCLKGCGRHILADIGLVGIRTNLYGKVERGVRLYFGGGYTYGDRVAKLLYWAVPLRKLNELLFTIYEDFKRSGFDDFEEYSAFMLRYNELALAYYFLQKMIGIDAKLKPFDEDAKLRVLELKAFAL